MDCGGPPLTIAATIWKPPRSIGPSSFSDANIATAIPLAMIVYSIAVVADSSWIKARAFLVMCALEICPVTIARNLSLENCKNDNQYATTRFIWSEPAMRAVQSKRGLTRAT